MEKKTKWIDFHQEQMIEQLKKDTEELMYTAQEGSTLDLIWKGKYRNMKDKNKYYTPTIEEFHVGFEYELKTEGEWVSRTLDIDYSLNRVAGGLANNTRVKHLDREDIESLGFEYSDMIDDNRLLFFKDVETERGLESCGLLYVPQTNWVLLYSHIKQVEGVLQGGYVIELPENKITVTGGTRFCGTIRNRSELKRVLTQIGVI